MRERHIFTRMECHAAAPSRRSRPVPWKDHQKSLANLYARNTAEKRGGGQTAVVLDEIAELVSDTDSVERELDRRELVRAIDAFLGTLPPRKKGIFVCRYWYFDSIPDIAARFGMTENAVAVTLHRLRRDLRDDLLERGFTL